VVPRAVACPASDRIFNQIVAGERGERTLGVVEHYVAEHLHGASSTDGAPLPLEDRARASPGRFNDSLDPPVCDRSV